MTKQQKIEQLEEIVADKQDEIDRLNRDNKQLEKMAFYESKERAFRGFEEPQKIYYRDELNIANGKIDRLLAENKNLLNILKMIIEPDLLKPLTNECPQCHAIIHNNPEV